MARKRTPAPLVELQDVSRAFGRTTVLEDVSLTIAPGEVLGLVGPNGGGKSTLLLLMAGLLRPTTGQVTVCGITAHELALTSAGKVGLVAARPGLYPLLSGRENLQHFGGLFGLSPDEVEQRGQPLLDSLALTEGLDRRVGQWSTGMQQKLSLVRALLLSPEVLLFDEPTANLDPVASQALYRTLRGRADGGLACALVTHDLAAAESICDRVLLLDRSARRELRFDDRRTPPPSELLEVWREEVGER
jgi:ABC-type multidrug transport system ATPase subunit